jgi:hypothetical protein
MRSHSDNSNETSVGGASAQSRELAQSLSLLSARTPDRIDASQIVTLNAAADVKQPRTSSCCDVRIGTGRARWNM